MIAILFITVVLHFHFLICEDSRDIDRIFIVQDLNPDDQEVQQLVTKHRFI